MNEPKKKIEKVIEHNIKTLYRPFKRCFKYPTNTITKWIWNVIQYGIYQKTESRVNGTPRTSGRNPHIGYHYASIKGCCGLQRNGFLR